MAFAADSPENATFLGLDTGARVALAGRLSDKSETGLAHLKDRAAERLARLKSFDASALSDQDRINLAVVRDGHEALPSLRRERELVVD